MAKRGSKVPHRSATRRRDLRVVGADVVRGQVAWHLTGILNPGTVAALQAELDGGEVQAGSAAAILTLVDHSLGGGVKDAFLVEGRRASRLRDDTWEQLADDPAAVIQDVDAARAAQVLIEALLEDPCPEDEEQVQTFADTDALLRSRAVFLAELAGLPVSAEALDGPAGDGVLAGDNAAREAVAVLRLKVQLVDVRPPVWRRLEVPSALTPAELHHVLQCEFGWDDAHLHAFERPVPQDQRGRGVRYRRDPVSNGRERRLRVGALLARQGDVLHYRYDFGDDWDHRIVVEERLDPVDGLVYPRCTGGRRAAPPEDCGGAPGYQNLLAALVDPAHPERDALLAWAREGFDPAAFSAAEADAALAWARKDRA